ncbi:sensor domain-containing diguanylate cyclase [Vibrio hangzhouensis]|uniref:Diguanylate cyclase with GAF sensor n=1 Tax=Vibrio hangzhouensis TaxID=462991 RepID=A0A1H5SZC6_9VIBR|nr:sensor domain-containing diguanylate cyclase [Vibrio hangzhouensis]SEF55268.1 diguanylate cyclase with GAF sensor [Vibrio hangzhouensis]
MQPAPIPANDDYRLRLIQQLNLLDTPEERFDRVTRLARRMFGVDIALVSIVDKKRQWFKSSAGLQVEETARDVSFCGHAILGDEPFIIPDASKDVRFNDNPLVLDEPKVRFYAGVPLKLKEGVKVGTLCIVDSQPRHFTDQQVQDLIDLAKLAEIELEANLESTIDELTQISNRRGFNLLAEKVMNVCRFHTEPYTLALFDLSSFQDINELHGHLTGDDALVQFSQLLLENFRDSDVIARVGGDEFAVLMSGTTGTDAHFPIMRFREQLKQFNQFGDKVYELGCGVGVVCCSPLEEISFSELFDKAQRALLATKSARY